MQAFSVVVVLVLSAESAAPELYYYIIQLMNTATPTNLSESNPNFRIQYLRSKSIPFPDSAWTRGESTLNLVFYRGAHSYYRTNRSVRDLKYTSTMEYNLFSGSTMP